MICTRTLLFIHSICSMLIANSKPVPPLPRSNVIILNFLIVNSSICQWSGGKQQKKRLFTPNLLKLLAFPLLLLFFFSSQHNISRPKRKRLIGFSVVNWTSPLWGPFCQDPQIPVEFKTDLEA